MKPPTKTTLLAAMAIFFAVMINALILAAIFAADSTASERLGQCALLCVGDLMVLGFIALWDAG